MRRTRRLAWPAVGLMVGVAVVVVSLLLPNTRASKQPSSFTLDLDPGTALSGSAPDFTLLDQLGRPVSLHDFLGRVVILAFNDSQCTTVCPLTTTAMVGAKRLLGAAGSQVQLLGIDANPTAIAVKDVRAYSEVHDMMRSWRFLTGSLPQLEHVWKAYNIAVQVEGGQIDHTPALYVIGTAGRLARVYLTQMSYASVGQQAQLLAQEASSLLPAHPRVQSALSYAQIPSLGRAAATALAVAGGGTLRLGGNGAPRLLLFFDTWDSEVTNLATQLEHLNDYVMLAHRARLPLLTAIDEGSVEPSPAALPELLGTIPSPLSYPVAIDNSGQVADGYSVQDEPWLTLVSPTGRILWYYDVSTGGWLTTSALVRDLRTALSTPASAPAAPAPGGTSAPAALAALQRQSGQLLGAGGALSARLQSLRDYPVVVNAWASWCQPCRAEFGLFASASRSFGAQVGFLGADAADSASDARAFLAAHPVSYPSYQTSLEALSSFAPIQGLPTTIFLNRSSSVVHVHIGQYESLGTLEADIKTYALGG